jgi:hypothetical protein
MELIDESDTRSRVHCHAPPQIHLVMGFVIVFARLFAICLQVYGQSQPVQTVGNVGD